MGFGYDAATDDYKLVTIQGAIPYVYSLKKDCWRKIKSSRRFVIFGWAEFVMNTLCWWEDGGDELGTALFVFNLEDEKLFELPLPDRLVSCSRTPQFIDLEGCLGLFLRLDNLCVMWQMKEYGVKDSWTQLYLIELGGPKLSRRNCLYLSWQGDKVFVIKNGLVLRYDFKGEKPEDTFYLSDLEEQKPEKVFQIDKIPHDIYGTCEITYVESLISLS